MTPPPRVRTAGAGQRANPEPVFVLAPPRSFSTITLALLSGHPQIYGFPELLVFAEATVRDLISGGTAKGYPPELHRGRLSGLYRAIADVHEGEQTPEAVNRAGAWLARRPDWPAPRVLAHLLQEVAPLVGAEKSPDTVATDEMLARCLDHFPNARYLHLTRHPVTTQRSMHAQEPKLYTHRAVRLVGAASSWYLAHSRIRARLAALPPQQWMRVRGEDLLRRPATTLPAVLDWLGLDPGEAVIARMLQTERWRFAGFGPSGDLYGGDRTFLTHARLRPVPDPGPVRFDPAWGLPEEMVHRMSRLAAELGYDVAEARRRQVVDQRPAAGGS